MKASDNSLHSSSQQAVINHIWNEWSPLLSPPEFKLVMFIYQRTFRFNKTAEKIAMSHFIYGVKDKNDVIIVAGLGISERQILRLIKSLEKKSVIMIRHVRNKINEYKLNIMLTYKFLLANICRINGSRHDILVTPVGARHDKSVTPDDARHDILVTPEVSRHDKSVTPGMTNLSSSGCQECHPKQEGLKQEINNMTENVVLPFKTVKDKLLEVELQSKSRTQEARSRKKQKNTTTAIWLIWLDNMQDYYPKYPITEWGVKEKSQAKKIFNEKLSNVDYAEFIETIIANWDFIIKSDFSFIKHNRPEFPNIGFMLKFITHFATSYYKFQNNHLHATEDTGDAEADAEVIAKLRKQNKQLLEEKEYNKKLAQMGNKVRAQIKSGMPDVMTKRTLRIKKKKFVPLDKKDIPEWD